MANPLDNPILIDGTMVLDETLGSYAKSTLNSYNPSYYVSLGAWSDTLGVIVEENDTLDSTVESGEDTKNYSVVELAVEKLNAYTEELLRNLSNKLIEYSWVIPDNYKIEYIPVFKLDSVYLIKTETDEIEEFSIITKVSLGRAGYKFITKFNKDNLELGITELKEKLNLLVNGVILFITSGISAKE